MKKKIVLVLIAIPFLLITACASRPSAQARGVRDADDRSVASCKFVRNVAGTSGWGNLAASTGIENAKIEARERAAKLGATHVVWNSVAGGYNPNVSGNAYKCE
jgi:hypothetical protein